MNDFYQFPQTTFVISPVTKESVCGAFGSQGWSPTNLGSLANLSKLYFTVKRLYTDLDSESEIQVEKTAGLVYINRGLAASPLHASIVVTDVNLGNITITVDAVETAKLDLLTDIYYDVQFINASGVVTTLVSGLVTIDGDATRGTT